MRYGGYCCNINIVCQSSLSKSYLQQSIALLVPVFILSLDILAFRHHTIPFQVLRFSLTWWVFLYDKLLSNDFLLVQGILSWLQTTDVDSFWAGLIFEQLWSYIFGAGTEYKHPAECTVFICNDGIPSLPPFQSSTQQMAILNSLMSRESSKTKVW